MAESVNEGAELDRKIAVVVGWNPPDYAGYTVDPKKGIVRFPSMDIEDAFAAAGNHLMDLTCTGGHHEMAWRCRWLAEQPGETDVTAYASTPALAICRAIILAEEARRKNAHEANC